MPKRPRSLRLRPSATLGLPALGLAALLAACGARIPPAAPASGTRLVGEWVSVDTVEVIAQIEETGEVFFWTHLRTHLAITDSTWTETSVTLSNTRLEGSRTVTPYRTTGDSVVSDHGLRAAVSLRGDTLTLTSPGDDAVRYVRGTMGEVPPDLLRLWVGLSPPDAAGVPAEFGFRFNADGTFDNGWGEPSGTYAVFGPYLLLREGLDSPDPQNGVTPFWSVLEMESGPALEGPADARYPVLRLRGGPDEPLLTLYGR